MTPEEAHQLLEDFLNQHGLRLASCGCCDGIAVYTGETKPPGKDWENQPLLAQDSFGYPDSEQTRRVV